MPRTRKQNGLASIIDENLDATQGTNAPAWALARYVAEEMTGTADERATIVADAYNARASERSVAVVMKPATIRTYINAHRTWGAVQDGAWHPVHAYQWNRLSKDDDGKRLEGDALVEAWKAIPATRPEAKKSAKDAGMTTLKVTSVVADRVKALADAAGVDVSTVILAALDATKE